MLAIGRDNVARLWDVATGKLVREFRGHTNIMWRGTFSPDGRYVFTTSQDKSARMWDVQPGEQLRYFPGHALSAVAGIAVSPDGGQVAIGSYDGFSSWRRSIAIPSWRGLRATAARPRRRRANDLRHCGPGSNVYVDRAFRTGRVRWAAECLGGAIGLAKPVVTGTAKGPASAGPWRELRARAQGCRSPRGCQPGTACRPNARTACTSLPSALTTRRPCGRRTG